MPRQNAGPRLVLYGPDTRRGAKARAGFRSYVWYVVWSDRGVKRERPTGTGDREAALHVLRQVTDEMTAAAAATDEAALPRPSEVLLGDILATYGEEHGTTVKDPVRLGVAIKRLSGYWGGRKAAEISKTTIEAYAKARRAEFAKTERERVRRAIAVGQTPAPARTLSMPPSAGNSSISVPRCGMRTPRAGCRRCQRWSCPTEASPASTT